MRPLAYLGSFAPFTSSAGFPATPLPFNAGVGGGGILCVATLIFFWPDNKRETGEV